MYLLILSLLFTLAHCCPDRCSCYDDLLNGGYITNCSDAGLIKPPLNLDVQTTLLDLSKNRIQDTSWQKWVLELHPRNITKIIATDNILTQLPEPPSPQIIMDVSSNPFYCDCDTILKLRALKSQLVSVGDIRCMSPPLPYILNKPIEQLNTNELSCVNTDLEIPAEITIYRVREQVIPCRKAEDFVGNVIWRKNGVDVYKTSKQDCSLTIRDVTAYNAGKYIINVENTFEKRTYILNVNLKASYAPTISVTNSIIVVPKLGTARIRCNVTGSPPPTVTWSPADNTGTSLDDPSIMLDGPTLILTEVDKEMVFVCTASNQMGVTRSTFIVKNETRRNTSHLFSMLALIALTIMVILVFLSVIYIVYSRQKLARLKDRCSSAASNNSGITYENSDAMSSITQCDGFKIITISPSSPPHQLICPITREWMKFPVVAGDGFSYEESAIRSWFKHNNTSPMTNGEISKLLIKNHNLRTLARDLIEQTPVPRSTSITQDLERTTGRTRNKSDNRRTRENSDARRVNSDIHRSHSVNGEVQSSIERAAVERSERAATEVVRQSSLRTVETNVDDGSRSVTLDIVS